MKNAPKVDAIFCDFLDDPEDNLAIFLHHLKALSKSFP